MSVDFYSVRMRASTGRPGAGPHQHLCGGERLVADGDAEMAAGELIRRALAHGVDAANIHVTLEQIPAALIRHASVLPVTTIHADNAVESRPMAESILREANVSEGAISVAFDHVLRGWHGCGQPLRGAVLLDARNGDRLDDAGNAGIRISHFDFAPGHREAIIATLADAGLSHHRTHEALALASKVIACGVVAEICWSDDREYAAGYVATAQRGYVRFPRFKPDGAVGGRAFFLSGGNAALRATIDRLKGECVLIDGPVSVRASQDIARAELARVSS
ncbi:MAG TPA: 6-carboxyhexanoate--CoA ligase [Vicinamibacterales bacterium]|jgi:6-carboxyhexanoate--CoA ligase|nr:6-carboxyhexanoate--CoA ligase [Vicinamibacterales bacterium]